ncbi:carbon storage regulator [Bacillaceae bacterium C204]|uniref:carbon storage regulator n=1 Tax=Neobacillus sp. 204 TaxID=3383351 RepID=UPI00397E5DA0
MLIVGREIGQSVIIDDVIKVTVLQIGSKLKPVIDVPKGMPISRAKDIGGSMDYLRKGTRIIGTPTLIGDNIKVTILQTESGILRFSIDAPKEINIYREELFKGNQLSNNQKAKNF